MQTVLITGATSGIGRAMALRLAADGYAVLAIGRDRKALAEIAGAGIETLALDVTDSAATAAALAGREIDVLVNNAGIALAPEPFDRADVAVLDRMIAVNLTAVVHLTRLVLPGMRARGRGHLVFTGSSAAHAPSPGAAVYSATKAAVTALANGIRGEVAADGIRVTEIVPGRVETGLYRDALDDASRAAIYAGHLSVQPEDIAEMLSTALSLPPHASVTRFDVMPTRPVPPLAKK